MRRLSHPGVAFLDRDGTINEKAPEGDYIKGPEELRLLPGAAVAIRRLNDAGVRVIVVTNQRGIALGRMTEDDLDAIHAELSARLRSTAGAHIDAFFHCPHDLGECDCRKPETGMFRQAQERFPWIDLDRSVLIGDGPADVEAGRRLGIATVRLGADAPDLQAAVNAVLDGDATAPDDLVGSRAAGPAALRGSVYRVAGYVLTVGMSLISAPLLIRHLGIAQFGRYSTVMAIAAVVAGVTDAGLATILVREWTTRSGTDRTSAIRSLLGIRLELSVAGVALGVGFALIAGYPEVMVIGTLIAGTGFMAQAVAHLLSGPLQAQLRLGLVALIDVVRQVVTVGLIVVLVLVGAGLLPFLAVPLPAGIAMMVIAAVLVRKEMSFRPTLRGTHWWPLLRDMLPFAAAVAAATVYFRLTIIVMSLIASAQQTGYFATSYRVIEVLIGVPSFTIAAAFPILSRSAIADRDRFAYATGRILELALMAGALFALGTVLAAPFVIDVIAGSKGAPASPVLQIQAIALASAFITQASSYALLSLRRHRELLLVNTAALVANVVLTLVLVPVAHARGAATAAVIAETLLAIGQLTALLRLRRTRLRIGSVPVVVLATAAGATPLLIQGLHPMLRWLAGCLIYVAVIALFGRLPPELLELVRGHRRAGA